MNKNSINFNYNECILFGSNIEYTETDAFSINKWRFFILKNHPQNVVFYKFKSSTTIFSVVNNICEYCFDIENNKSYKLHNTQFNINNMHKCNDILFNIPPKEVSSFNKAIMLQYTDKSLDKLVESSKQLIPQIIKATPNISNKLAVVKSIKLALELDNYSRDLRGVLERKMNTNP